MSVVDGRPAHGITDEFVARLAERADEAERLRRLPAATVTEFKLAGALAESWPGRWRLVRRSHRSR